MTAERAYAKVNLVLQVGEPRADGMHPICSLFASLDLADEIEVAEAETDAVVCPGVEGPNLAARAIAELRKAISGLPGIAVRIEKRIPVAAGLGGGSADAAAVLRAANELVGGPLAVAELREIAARVGADVPSQITPAHALVTGVGDSVEPLALPPMALVLVPSEPGLPTTAVYRELDRMGLWRRSLDPEHVRRLARAPLAQLAAGTENDLEPAALSLRPELARDLERLRAAGALAAAISGSGPTAFGLFEGEEAATRAAKGLPGAVVAGTRGAP